jgi:hypothetical protein
MLRLADRTRDALRDGEVITGFVWPVGAKPRLAATLQWSPESGAFVGLVEPTSKWGVSFDSGTFVAHMSVNGGEEFTLLDARVRSLTAFDEVSGMSGYTLALGALVEPADPWSRATYSTANLSEWDGESGISVTSPQEGPVAVRLEWRAPEKRIVELGDAVLTFATTMSSSGNRHAADWAIRTTHEMHVDPSEPRTIDALHRDFAQPLRALATFVSDRPDSLIRELVRDKEGQRTAEVWRCGPQVAIRPWSVPGHGRYVCSASQLPEFADAIRRWWTLHEKAWPALGVFAQHVTEGSTYSPARLITVFSALEAYARAHLGTKDLRKVRRHAGVPSDITGCTDSALELLGYCRGHFAHLTQDSQKYSASDADAGTFPSIRRASALMQACLLRDLGFDAKETEELLRAHFANWPIP